MKSTDYDSNIIHTLSTEPHKGIRIHLRARLGVGERSFKFVLSSF